MPYQKGQSGNPKGKSKGSLNKDKSLLIAFARYVVEDGYNKFSVELNKLHGEKYVKLFMKMYAAACKLDPYRDIKATEYIIEFTNKKLKDLNIKS